MTTEMHGESGDVVIPPESWSTGCQREADVPQLQCPLCGGTRIRKRSGPLVVSLVSCAVLVMLGLFSFWVQSFLTMLILSVGLQISLFVMPVAIWVAVVGRHRCRSCGHRFAPSGQYRQDGAAPESLWPWFIAGGVLVYLLCLVAPSVLLSQTAGPDIRIPTASLAVDCIFFAWLSAVCQAVIYFGLRKRLRRQAVWAVLLVLPALVLGSRSVYLTLPTVRARALLAHIGAASLPPSTRQIKVWTTWGPDQADAYVRFTADSNDIDRFLAASPILAGVEYEDVAQGQGEPVDPSGENAFVLPSSGYFVEEDGPQWFGERLTTSTRRYYIPFDDEGLSTEVAIDDHQNIIYIHQRSGPHE